MGRRYRPHGGTGMAGRQAGARTLASGGARPAGGEGVSAILRQGGGAQYGENEYVERSQPNSHDQPDHQVLLPAGERISSPTSLRRKDRTSSARFHTQATAVLLPLWLLPSYPSVRQQLHSRGSCRP